jgi:hypothetical protein
MYFISQEILIGLSAWMIYASLEKFEHNTKVAEVLQFLLLMAALFAMVHKFQTVIGLDLL